MDEAGRIIESRDAACEDDDGAAELARAIVAGSPHIHAIETWLRPRLVCRVGGEAAVAAAVRRRR